MAAREFDHLLALKTLGFLLTEAAKDFRDANGTMKARPG